LEDETEKPVQLRGHSLRVYIPLSAKYTSARIFLPPPQGSAVMTGILYELSLL
jgi:hypothetical protein